MSSRFQNWLNSSKIEIKINNIYVQLDKIEKGYCPNEL